eukprot:545021_1
MDSVHNKNMFLIVIFVLIFSNCINCIDGELDFYFNGSSQSSLSFGNTPLYCIESLNVSLINPTNNSILIDTNYINNTQFLMQPSLTNYHLHSYSHINLSISFTPITNGSQWSYLSIHTNNDNILYLYLYGVGIHNKYNMKPISFNSYSNSNHKNHTIQTIKITNPFNNTLIIKKININPQINGLYLSYDHHQEIEANTESTISSITCGDISLSPSPSPKYKEINEKNNEINDNNSNENNNEIETVSLNTNLIVNTNYDTLSIPITIESIDNIINEPIGNNIEIPTIINNNNKKNRKKKHKYYFPLIDFNILTRP